MFIIFLLQGHGQKFEEEALMGYIKGVIGYFSKDHGLEGLNLRGFWPHWILDLFATYQHYSLDIVKYQ
jgi:hypothetical protein